MNAEFLSMLSLALALAWASGINVYAVFIMLGFGSLSGLFELPNSLDFTTYPLVLGIAVFMFMIEFVVDKIPIVDSGWDSFHTFIRIFLGAFLASKVFGEENFAFLLFVGLIGAFISGTSHSMKAGTRVIVNTSPEPFSNMIISLFEDIAVFGGIYLAFKYPSVFILFFCAYVFALIWLLPKVWRGIKKVFNFIFKEKKEEFAENSKEEKPYLIEEKRI